MKAPALRVIKAKITSKFQEEIRAAQKASSAIVKKFYADREAHRIDFQNRVVTEVARNIKRYAQYFPGTAGTGSRFAGTSKYDQMVQALREKYPAPKEPKCGTQAMYCASLDLYINVPEARTVDWTKFINECDDAFLNDDAKKILEALEVLG